MDRKKKSSDSVPLISEEDRDKEYFPFDSHPDDTPYPPLSIIYTPKNPSAILKFLVFIYNYFMNIDLVSNFIVSLKYLYSDSLKNPRNYYVAISTIFISVTLVVALATAVDKAPLIFIKLSENSVGEYDLLMTAFPQRLSSYPSTVSPYSNSSSSSNITKRQDPDGGGNDDNGNNGGGTNGLDINTFNLAGLSGGALLNETYINSILKSVPRVRGTSPRWTMLARLSNRFDPLFNASVVILVIDSEKEKQMGVGRSWDKSSLGDHQIYVSQSVLNAIGIDKSNGDWATLSFELGILAQMAGGSADILGMLTNNNTMDAMKDAARVGVESYLDSRNITDLNISLSRDNLDVIREALQATLNLTVSDEIIESVLETTGYVSNGTLYIPVNQFVQSTAFDALFDFIYQAAMNANANISADAFTFSTQVMVKDSFVSGDGKWPSALGNVVVLEAKWLSFLLADFLPFPLKSSPSFLRNLLLQLPTPNSQTPSLNTSTSSSLSFNEMLLKFPISEYALSVVVQMDDRITTYLKSATARDSDFIHWTNHISDALGYGFPATYILPLQATMKGTDIAAAFLHQIFLFIVCFLLALSVVVIYSLLLTNVDDKKYEFAMLRVLGFKKNYLVELLTIQAVIYFAMPAIAAGFLIAWLLNIPTSIVIGNFTALDLNYDLSTASIIYGITLGLVIPIVGNIYPIRKALGKNLRDSLDMYHFNAKDSIVSFERLDSYSINFLQFIIAILMITTGFVCFYVIPWSFIFQIWEVFIFILNVTLYGMVFGLAMISIVTQPILEGYILSFFLTILYPLSSLHSIIKKNLSSHRHRNRKTSLMFTVILTFVIFTNTMSFHQTRSLTDNFKASAISGSDLVIYSFSFSSAPLRETEMRQFLTEQKYLYSDSNHFTDTDGGPPIVKDFTFVTFPLHYYSGSSGTPKISSLAQTPRGNMAVYGVEENYLSAAYAEFTIVTSSDSGVDYPQIIADDGSVMPDIVKSLYTSAGGSTLDIETQFRNKGHFPPPTMTSGTTTHGEEVWNYPDFHDFISKDKSFSRAYTIPSTFNENSTLAYTYYSDVIYSTAAEDSLSVKMRSPMLLNSRFEISNPVWGRLKTLMKPRNFVSKMAGFFFTWIPPVALGYQPGVISMPEFLRLMNITVSARDEVIEEYDLPIPKDNAKWREEVQKGDIKKQKLLVKLKSKDDVVGSSNAGKKWSEEDWNKKKEFIKNSLKNYAHDDRVTVIDTQEIIDSMAFATDMLLYLFYIASGIAVLLCFFVLWVSFTANVRENTWEFGVLRAVGLSTTQVIWIYILEALTIFIAAQILATIIGTLISQTLIMQGGLFDQLPYKFYFPWLAYTVVCTMSIFVAILGSYLPAKQLSKKQIAGTLKGAQ